MSHILLVHVPCDSLETEESSGFKRLKQEFMDAYFSYRLVGTYSDLNPSDLLDMENLHRLNLALLSFAKVLREQGHNVGYVTAMGREEVIGKLEGIDQKPELVALSCSHQSSVPLTQRLAEMARDRWGAHTIAGGQIVNFYSSMEKVDIVVHGSGFLPLIWVAQNPGSRFPRRITHVPTAVAREFHREYFLYPDLSLMPNVSMPVGRIYFQRGCLVTGLHACKACLAVANRQLQIAGNLAYLTDVLRQMERVFGTRHVFIGDDDFLVQPQNVEKILFALIKEKSSIRFSFQCRVSSFLRFIEEIGEEKARELFRDARVIEVQFGAESPSQKVIDIWWGGKHETRRLEDALSIAKKLGLFTLANFQFGFPGETPEEMDSTRKMISQLMGDESLDFADPYFPHMPRGLFSSGEIQKWGMVFDGREEAQGSLSEFPSMWHRGTNRESIAAIRNECMEDMTRIFLARLKQRNKTAVVKAPRMNVT